MKRAHIVKTFRQGIILKTTFNYSNINVAFCCITRHVTHLQTYLTYLITFTIKAFLRQNRDTTRLIILRGPFCKDAMHVFFLTELFTSTL